MMLIIVYFYYCGSHQESLLQTTTYPSHTRNQSQQSMFCASIESDIYETCHYQHSVDDQQEIE